jgi:hypothetical protein
MSVARELHTATLLPHGIVLVAGGDNSTGALSSAELYVLGPGLWVPTGSMAAARTGHGAVPVPAISVCGIAGAAPDFVLAMGGYDSSATLASAELYNIAAGTWGPTGTMVDTRDEHAAAILKNGKVLVTGGVTSCQFRCAYSSSLLYDAPSGTWSVTGSMTTPRFLHTETLLEDGQVLVSGGLNASATVLASAELYDPENGEWKPTGSMNGARDRAGAALLENGKVLVAGGLTGPTPLASAELYDPATATWSLTGA